MNAIIQDVLAGLPYNKAHRTGSNFICNPPVENTDIDIVLWYEHPGFEQIAFEQGWEGGEDYGVGRLSFRKGKYNIIALRLQEDFYRWVGATYVAKLLNLQEKADRIMMFSAITQWESFPAEKVF